MRSLITLIFTIIGVYYGFNSVTVIFGTDANTTLSFENQGRLPNSNSVYIPGQDGSRIIYPQASFHTGPSDHTFGTNTGPHGLIGQSTSTEIVDRRASGLMRSYTVKGLAGACAYNCAD